MFAANPALKKFYASSTAQKYHGIMVSVRLFGIHIIKNIKIY